MEDYAQQLQNINPYQVYRELAIYYAFKQV